MTDLRQSWFWQGWFSTYLNGCLQQRPALFRRSFVTSLCGALCAEPVHPVSSEIILVAFPATESSSGRAVLCCASMELGDHTSRCFGTSLLHSQGIPDLLLCSFNKLLSPSTCFRNSLQELLLPVSFPHWCTPHLVLLVSSGAKERCCC